MHRNLHCNVVPLVLALCAAALLQGPAFAGKKKPKSPLKQGVEVRMTEVAGVARSAEPVTFGFPLGAKDKVKNAKKLAVFDAEGNRVPAQFRALQRWQGAPDDAKKPVRWMLVDFQADCPASGTAVYTIRTPKKKKDGKEPPAPPLFVAEDAAGITVDTGAAVFRLSRQSANFLDEVRADLDGDGFIAADERVIDADGASGFELEDRLGAAYTSVAEPVTLTVEEAGRLRVVIRADGRHGPAQPGGGIGRDFFQYRARYTFNAGKPWVRVQHTLRNAYLDDPLGNIGFEDYAIAAELASGLGAMTATYGVRGGSPVVAGGASRLLQDSDGGANWSQSPGTTFQGFRVFDGTGQVDASGAQASGVLRLSNADVAVSLAMRDFFENFPKGFDYDGGRKLRFDLFPEEFGAFHWLDDGQQKTTDFLLAVHAAGDAAADQAERAFLAPLRPYADPQWTRLTRAWADQGDLDAPPANPAAMLAKDQAELDSRYASAFNHTTAFLFGWCDFGEMVWAMNTHTTGSPRNRLTYFDRFALTGSYAAFRVNELFALHSRDLRPYHIDGFSKEARPNAVLWEGLPVWSQSPDKLGRDALDPALAPHRAGIPAKGHGWNGFDFEHMMLDDVFEYYLLTGDPVSLDSLREIGECQRTWRIYDPTKQPGSTRGIGWTLRALVKIFQATGDPRFGAAADDLVNAVAQTYGKGKSPVTGEVYHYVTRFPPIANHIATMDYDLPWQQAVAVHGLLLHHAETKSPTSLALAEDVAGYMVDFGWNGVAMNESLACDDHNVVHYSDSNMGVNLWIPSALALVTRATGATRYLDVATQMYESVPAVHDPNSYLGYGVYHWWHSYKSIAGAD